MLTKYYHDTIILMPDIDLSLKDLYSYKWYINNKLIGTNYKSSYIFPYSGFFDIKLITTNRENGLTSTTTNRINVIVNNRSIIPLIIEEPEQ